MDPIQPISPNTTGLPNDLLTGMADSQSRGSISESIDQPGSLVKLKEAELKEMQDQIESYNQMVKQLTSQREMAVKRLADMSVQIEELNKALEAERIQVEAKDKELKSRRTQLESLKNEEDELKEKFDLCQKELDTTCENLSTTQLQETQIGTKLTELKQFLTSTNDAIDDIEKAISIKDTIKLSALCNQPLTPPPLSINALLTNGIKSNSSASPLPGQTPNATTNGDSLFDGAANFDPFAGEDPFAGDDPFKAEDTNLALPEDDPFNPSSSSALSGLPVVFNDPFAPPIPSDRSGF